MKTRNERDPVSASTVSDTAKPHEARSPADVLRLRAEELFREKVARSSEEAEVLSLAEARHALHELSVHQIELEMQAEELRQQQAALEISQARYCDLYDLAPVSYCTLSEKGLILEANLTAATLFGIPRGALIKQPFSRFISEEDENSYYLFRHRLFATNETQNCELRMVKKDGGMIWAYLTATVAQEHDGSRVCHIALSDITERKRAEESERDSEVKLDGILESTADGILAVDNAGKVIKTNSRFAELWRVPESLLKSHSDNALLSFVVDQLSEPEAFLKKVQMLYKSDAADMDMIAFKDGRIFERYSIPIRSENHVMGRVWSFRDITARMQLDVYRDISLSVLQCLNGQGDLKESIQSVIALVKTQTGADAVGLRLKDGEDFPYFVQQGFSEEFLLTENMLAEHGPDGKVCRDRDGNVCLECACGLVLSGKTDPASPFSTRGGSCWTNDSFALYRQQQSQDPRHHPRTPCMSHGYCSMALIPIKDKERIVGLLQLNARRKDFFTLDTVKILEDFATHIGASLTRREAEATLRESEDRFRYLVTNTPAIIYTCRVNGDYGATFVSDNVLPLLGYRPEDFTQCPSFWKEHVHPDDLARVFAEVKNALQVSDTHEHEYRFRRKDETYCWMFDKVRLIRDATGQPYEVIGHMIDITDRKLTEDERQKIDKLQSIGTLAGGIAHDFNNILTGLFGNISLAMEDLSITHPSYAFLDEAGKSMNRAVRLTKQLLTFAKGGDPVKENITLGNMVEEVARFDLTGSNVSLVYHSADDLWSIDADKGQIQQAVSNLVINAREAMPKGGRLLVTLANADISEEAVPTLSPGRYVKVIVKDEGEGISPKVRDHIFDPYFTTKQTGSGLGLTTVWSIISRHGGHITVVSELGKGATFTFYLPASVADRPTETKQPAAECSPSTRPAKILVMDDDDAVSKLIVRLLAPCGYSVTTVPDGQETIALYRQALEAGSTYDAVILDLTIPGGPGGAEVIKDLLVLDPDVRAIVSSGYANDPVMANASAYGFKSTVAKPYTAKALRETVARVLA